MNLHTAVYVTETLSERLYCSGYRGVADMDRIAAVVSAYSTHHRARKGLADYLLGCGVRDDYAPRIAALIVRAYWRGRDWGSAGAFATVLVALNDVTGGLRDDQTRVKSLINIMEKYACEEITRDQVRVRLTRGSYWHGRSWIAKEILQYWCA